MKRDTFFLLYRKMERPPIFFEQAAEAGSPYAVLHVDPDEVENLLKEQGESPVLYFHCGGN